MIAYNSVREYMIGLNKSLVVGNGEACVGAALLRELAGNVSHFLGGNAP